MKRLVSLALALLVAMPAIVSAHPMPFTYLDVRLDESGADVSLVAHIFDVGHDLMTADQGQFMDPATIASRRQDLFALFADRLSIGGRTVQWSDARLLPERSSVQLVGRVGHAGGALPIHASLFPYDPAHQTFVNVYEAKTLTLQAILGGAKPELEYFPGSRQGVFAVMQRFVPDGMRHVVRGPEHWLFLLGLVLLGATYPQTGRILLAFAAADALTTTLIIMNVVHPSAKLTDPALALAVVYVGADNLMVRGGRDVRPWIALAFGVLHGFWFGGGLALMDLPRAALGWSLVGFHLGELTAIAAIVLVVTTLLRVVPAGRTAELVKLTGSVVVIVGGVSLFVQRVFFPGGLV